MIRLRFTWPVLAFVSLLAGCARDAQAPAPESHAGLSHVLLTDP
jgi:hypothetical protein